MDYNFKRNRIDKISRDKIVDELKNAAKIFNFIEFKRKDFDKIANISSATVKREFGTWENALTYLGKIGVVLKTRHRGHFSKQELFDEMERVWKHYGHRPSIIEWDNISPKISHKTYIRYFNGWQNACLSFIEHKMGSKITTDDEYSVEDRNSQPITKEPKESRTIPLGIRLKVLDRDNFRCVFCGRSPATDVGVQLHIDHIMPYSKGGKSIYENLQTLCKDCNIGKSNKEKIGQNII